MIFLRQRNVESQEQVANAIGIKRSTYSYYENGRTEPSASTVGKIASHFEVSVDDLLFLDLTNQNSQRRETGDFPLNSDQIRVLPVVVSVAHRENISFVPVRAIAGYVNGHSDPEFFKELPQFNVPKLAEGTFRAFEIQGDSMPPVHDGYVVIGRYVESWRDLKNGQRFVLITKHHGVMFKRLVFEKKNFHQLILISDNPDYLPFSIDLVDLIEAWEIVAHISYLRV